MIPFNAPKSLNVLVMAVLGLRSVCVCVSPDALDTIPALTFFCLNSSGMGQRGKQIPLLDTSHPGPGQQERGVAEDCNTWAEHTLSTNAAQWKQLLQCVSPRHRALTSTA